MSCPHDVQEKKSWMYYFCMGKKKCPGYSRSRITVETPHKKRHEKKKHHCTACQMKKDDLNYDRAVTTYHVLSPQPQVLPHGDGSVLVAAPNFQPIQMGGCSSCGNHFVPIDLPKTASGFHPFSFHHNQQLPNMVPHPQCSVQPASGNFVSMAAINTCSSSAPNSYGPQTTVHLAYAGGAGQQDVKAASNFRFEDEMRQGGTPMAVGYPQSNVIHIRN